MIQILTLTELFPSVERPRHGIFVEERLRHLLAGGAIDARILAPVPWFPLRGAAFGRYGRLARIPRREERLGRPVEHPRYLTIPRVGMSLAPFLMALSLYRAVRRACRAEPRVQVIDSHFLYPDGVAACLLGRILGLPVVLTARGSDVNVFTRHLVPRMLIRWATRRAARVVTVSDALRRALLALGTPAERVVTLRNGVDRGKFAPGDRASDRSRLGLAGPVLLSVGNLLEIKGHHLLIDALPKLPGVTAIIVGEGPEAGALAARARAAGVEARVRLVGNVDQAELAAYYRAADALVLASRMEGLPNVVLESLACGTPVIATAVGGIPEVLDSPEAGILLPDRSADAIRTAAARILAEPPDRRAVAAIGARHGWEPTVRELSRLFTAVAGGPG